MIKNKILVAITVWTLLLAFTARATEGGATHYISGEYSDFCGMPPSQPGFYAGNYFLDYGNGEAGAGKELPLGGIFAAGVKANMQAEVPLAIYAYPFSLADITFSSGATFPIVWVDVKATATFNQDGTPRSGALELSATGLGDI